MWEEQSPFPLESHSSPYNAHADWLTTVNIYHGIPTVLLKALCWMEKWKCADFVKAILDTNMKRSFQLKKNVVNSRL